MRFRVGDVVVLKRYKLPTQVPGVGWTPLGAEGEIVRVGRLPSRAGVDVDCYVDFGEGLRACFFDQLAPKRPPAFERGSWDEIERVTGWSPKVVA